MKQILQLIKPFREMRKIAAFSFVLFALIAIPMGMWGQTRTNYEFNLNELYQDGTLVTAKTVITESVGTLTFTDQNEDFTILMTKNSGNQPGFYTSNGYIRFYNSDIFKLSAADGITMTQITVTSNGSSFSVAAMEGLNTSTKTWTGSASEVTFTGSGTNKWDKLTITYSSGGSQTTTYTVTYDCNGGTSGCPENVTGLESGEEITLANAPTKTDYDFAGWNDGNNTYDAGDEYTVNGNVTFTAQWTEVVSGDVHWVLTDLANLTSSDVFVIVGNGYAMTNNNGTSAAPATSAVTINGDKITSTVNANIKWTVSGDATNGYTFYPNGSTSTWLYCSTTASSSNNNNMRVGTGDRKVFEMNSNGYLMTKDTYTTRYLSIYDNADWRGYTNTNLCPQMSFYKKVTGDILPPSITANNVSIAYDATSGEIEYTLNNPTTEGTLSVSENVDWISNATLSTAESKVTFTTTANEANTSREGIITITYSYGDNETVSKDVTVTQAAAPVIYSTIPALFAAATSTETDVLVTFNNWVVSGVSSNGKNVFVTDNNGNGFVIYSSTDMSSTYAAGDILSGAAVSCKLKTYNGFAELLNVNAADLSITSGGTVTVADVAMADLAGVNTGALLHYDNLTCTVDNNKYYLSDGTTNLQVYNAIYAFNELEAEKTYNITGVYQQYNNTKEILPRSAADIVEVVVPHEEYTLTVTPSANVEIYTFVSDDPNEEGQSGELIAQVYDGTTVGLSVSAASGYMLESVLVDGVDVTSQLDETGWYEFTMPTHDVAVTATAVEDVPFEGGTYILATSIESGKRYIIVGQGDSKYYAMGVQNNNNRAAVEISVDGTTATVSSEDVHEFTISSLDTTGFYSIQDASSLGYLYAAGSGSNYLKTEATLDENHNGDWEISIDSEGIASVVASNSNNRNVMQYNSVNKLFACYSLASQHPVYLYVKEETPVTEPHTVYFYEGTGDCGTVSLTGSSITLPEAENVDGWAFAGWSTAAVNESATAPATLVTSPYAPAEDMPLYAVYVKNGVYSTFPACVYTQLDVTEGFETYAEGVIPDANGRTRVKPTGWTVVTQYDPKATTKLGRPQMRKAAYYAHQGQYSLLMDSLTLLAMPELEAGVQIQNVEMELYVKQMYDFQSLVVGVMSDLSDPSTFVAVTVINNVGEAINRRVIDFVGYEGTGRYIAFLNQYSEEHGMRKSFNYIDDITIRERVESNCGITSLPIEWSFEAGAETTTEVGSCWTLVNRDGYSTAQYDPQVIDEAYYANTGQGSLKLDGRCVYAMPEFKVEGKDISNVRMEFSVRQYSAQCQLQVGVMSDVNNVSSFVPLETLSNGGTTGHQRHVIDFSAYQIPQGAKYIVFRNVYSGTWGRSPQYIDDIMLSIPEESTCGITSLPSVWSFESDSSNTSEVEDCWTLVSRNGYSNSQYDPHIQNYAYYSNASQSSLMLDGRCVYAMPEFKVDGKSIRDVQMELYVRQYSSACSLEVGVMSSVNNANSFVMLTTISNAGASGHQNHVIDFSEYAGQIPSDAKYIAFRNVYSGTWGRSPQYLDDVILSVPEAKIAEVSGEDVIEAVGVERYLEGIAVYPNPTRGMLYIDAMDVQKVECFNQMGKLVAVYDNENTISISNLANGVYMLRITVPQGVTMRKVVKR